MELNISDTPDTRAASASGEEPTYRFIGDHYVSYADGPDGNTQSPITRYGLATVLRRLADDIESPVMSEFELTLSLTDYRTLRGDYITAKVGC
jgi:hypothetical protein